MRPFRSPRACAALTAVAAFAATVLGSAAPASAAARPSVKDVSYHGYHVNVPATWPVIDLAKHPLTCVRLDRDAPEEALALRAAGISVDQARILCWLWTPDGPWEQAVRDRIDISISSEWALRGVVAGRASGHTSPAPRNRTTLPSRPSWTASTGPWRSPSAGACGRRCVISPTPPPP